MLTSDPDPCTGEFMLTTSSEKVEAMLCKLASIEVGIPYDCSRPPNGIEKPGGIEGRFRTFPIGGGMRRLPRPNVS